MKNALITIAKKAGVALSLALMVSMGYIGSVACSRYIYPEIS
jgi:hypothetical protein